MIQKVASVENSSSLLAGFTGEVLGQVQPRFNGETPPSHGELLEFGVPINVNGSVQFPTRLPSSWLEGIGDIIRRVLPFSWTHGLVSRQPHSQPAGTQPIQTSYSAIRGAPTVSDELFAALNVDLTRGAFSLPAVREVLREKVVPVYGEEAAIALYDTIASKNLATKSVNLVLGPDFIESAIHDIKLWKGRIEEGRNPLIDNDGKLPETPRAIQRNLEGLTATFSSIVNVIRSWF